MKANIKRAVSTLIARGKRPTGIVVRCPLANNGKGHYFPFRMNAKGTITGYGKCIYCGKTRKEIRE